VTDVIKPPIKKRSIKSKALTIVLLSIFVITAVLGYVFFIFSKNRITYMMGESIKGIVATATNFIPPEDLNEILHNSNRILRWFEKVRERSAFSSFGPQVPLAEQRAETDDTDRIIQYYLRYSQMLHRIKVLNSIDSPINVYTREGSRLKLVLTSEEALLLGAYYSMRNEVKDVCQSGSPMATKIYRDKDGAWISAYAPITYLIPGNVIGILEINYRIDTYLSHIQRDLGVIILICVLGFCVVSLLSYPLVNRLVSDIKTLERLAANLQEDKYDAKIEVKSDDEVGRLADTFEHLRLSIRDKIHKLQAALKREKRAHLESIVALTNAIELRDPYTRGHVYRVEKYALLIAKALGLNKEETEKLKYSCFLHDVGKIDVEAALLQKKDILTKEDFENIKKHAEKGARIVEGIRFLKDVKDVILYHQERYDGKGYPKGLQGDHIPLLARVIAVADAFDAMTTDRPYRSKVSFKEAIQEIEKKSGTQFDPVVCKAFLRYRDQLEDIAKDHFEGLGEIV